jgi:UDP-N-acetyl-2-amino-2-deoxyglucuronate dehydrogenase
MNTHRVGIIGCGAIFSQHAFSLHIMDNTEVNAVCDIKPEALKRATGLFQCEGYADYKKMLKRDDLDVIHVLTPHHLHAPMAIEAANADKHVLTEKPMAIEIDDARAMVDTAKKNDVALGVISQNRYNAASVAVKKALESGDLGKVISQRILMTWAKPESYYQASDWRGTWDKEGGALLIDQAIHLLDLARWFVDDEIGSVEATFTNRLHPSIQTEDTAEGLIQYRNGARTVFYATNNNGYDAPPIVETFCEGGIATVDFNKATITYIKGKEIVVVSDPTEGYDETLFTEFFNQSPREMMFEIFRKWGLKFSPIRWKAGAGGAFGLSHLKQIKNFYDSLDKNTLPDVHGEEALRTQEMICAIYQSAKEQKKIQLH